MQILKELFYSSLCAVGPRIRCLNTVRVVARQVMHYVLRVNQLQQWMDNERDINSRIGNTKAMVTQELLTSNNT